VGSREWGPVAGVVGPQVSCQTRRLRYKLIPFAILVHTHFPHPPNPSSQLPLSWLRRLSSEALLKGVEHAAQAIGRRDVTRA